jgi:hypothetical protein
MTTEDSRGTSVLSITHLRARLNDLEHRVLAYAHWLGAEASVRHGDTSQGVRRRPAKAELGPQIPGLGMLGNQVGKYEVATVSVGERENVVTIARGHALHFKVFKLVSRQIQFLAVREAVPIVRDIAHSAPQEAATQVVLHD